MVSHIFSRIATVCVALMVSGCVTSSSNYSGPSISGKVDNEVIIDEGFEVVWDRLVRNLSADFFVINNIEKASRLINLSFSSQSPSEFIDCGNTSRTFKNMAGTQSYNYITANSSYYTTTDANNQVFNVVRSTELDGRVNIYVAPESGKTQVRVNSRYILNVNLAFTNALNQPAGSKTGTWSFNTNAPFSKMYPETGDTVRCTSTSEIEDRILRAAGG